MAETIISMGIDVGTSTTQVVFSELTIENLASAFSVPRITIVDKKVIYRGQIHQTPLVSRDEVDAEALQQIVTSEFQLARLRPEQVSTGAAIITGETARAANAASVLASLSQLAGDFVVATAGPDLESVLAARGTGLDAFSQTTSKTVANLDIGGGTTNIACYQAGRLLATSCLDIGGRLLQVQDGKISYLYESLARLAEAHDLSIRVGDAADLLKLRQLAALMSEQLMMGIHLVQPDAIHERLYTNAGVPLPVSARPQVVSFSGGVADLIDSHPPDPFCYGDIGPLLGKAIAESSALAGVERRIGAETIAATVVGAGVHTTEISGSTIEYAAGGLPVRNIPILRVDAADEADPDRLAAAIEAAIRLHHPDQPHRSVAISLSGAQVHSFQEIQRTAEAIIRGAQVVLEGPNPLIVVVEKDRAKALGQSIAILRGRRDGVICIDGVQTVGGDYIDIGLPVGEGRAVPVVVKTLVFND